MKWIGAGYLIVTGVLTLLRKPSEIDPDQAGVSRMAAFRQGVLVNTLNPKTALFFLSIFPQFVKPNEPHPAVQSLTLGLIFVVLATIFNCSYSLMASSMRHLLLRGRTLPIMRRWVSGGMFIGLGVLAAATGHHRTAHT